MTVPLKVLLRSVLVRGFAASAEFNASVRSFRNRLVVTSTIVVVACAVLIVLQALNPTAMFFAIPADGAGLDRWLVLVMLMVFGVVGGLLTSIRPLAAIPRVKSPYNFPLQQTFVKMAVGALTALVGVMIAGNVGVAGFNSVQSMMVAAVVFGAGQQAVTRFLDKRAEQILDKMPTT